MFCQTLFETAAVIRQTALGAAPDGTQETCPLSSRSTCVAAWSPAIRPTAALRSVLLALILVFARGHPAAQDCPCRARFPRPRQHHTSARPRAAQCPPSTPTAVGRPRSGLRVAPSRSHTTQPTAACAQPHPHNPVAPRITLGRARHVVRPPFDRLTDLEAQPASCSADPVRAATPPPSACAPSRACARSPLARPEGVEPGGANKPDVCCSVLPRSSTCRWRHRRRVMT